MFFAVLLAGFGVAQFAARKVLVVSSLLGLGGGIATLAKRRRVGAAQ